MLYRLTNRLAEEVNQKQSLGLAISYTGGDSTAIGPIPVPVPQSQHPDNPHPATQEFLSP